VRGEYGASGFAKWERGCEYSFTSNGCDADDTAFCAEGALGTEEESCAHPEGAITAASSRAEACRRAENTVESCIRIISINQV
jgi:hypothetical protein